VNLESLTTATGKIQAEQALTGGRDINLRLVHLLVLDVRLRFGV
jgi:hypothetical protein